jgi:hypothetical protein
MREDEYQGFFFKVSLGALVVPVPLPLVSLPPVSTGVAGNLLVSAGLSLPTCVWPESAAALSVTLFAELPWQDDKNSAAAANK